MNMKDFVVSVVTGVIILVAAVLDGWEGLMVALLVITSAAALVGWFGSE